MTPLVSLYSNVKTEKIAFLLWDTNSDRGVRSLGRRWLGQFINPTLRQGRAYCTDFQSVLMVDRPLGLIEGELPEEEVTFNPSPSEIRYVSDNVQKLKRVQQQTVFLVPICRNLSIGQYLYTGA